MEQNEEKTISVLKERSYLSCISLGLRESFCHLGLLLRYAWPSLLAGAILPFPFAALVNGQLDAILRKWTELGYVPDVRFGALRNQILDCTVREAVFMVGMAILGSSFAGLVFLLVYLGMPVWSVVLAIVAFILLVFPFSVPGYEVAFSDKNLHECIDSLKDGFRNYGTLLAFNVLLGILCYIVALIGCLPFLVVLYVWTQAMAAEGMGDTVHLPALFPGLIVLSFLLAMFVSMILQIMVKFCQCLLWGSMTASRQEEPSEPVA